MANVKKSERVQDADIRRYNHVGLGLKAIADRLGCHAATVTTRLKAMGIKPTDTRRSFLEQVFTDLTVEEQEWLSHNLFNANIDIREFIVELIKREFTASPDVAVPEAAPMPELQTAPQTIVGMDLASGPDTTFVAKVAPSGQIISIDVAPGLPDRIQDLVETVPVSPELETQTKTVAVTTVAEIVDQQVEPEYVASSLPVPICGVCHENAVEREGQTCVSCGKVPETTVKSVFGK